MARRFGSTPFAEILPHSLARDDGLKAVAESLDKILAPAVPGIVSLLIYGRLSGANPETLLPPFMRLANLAGGLPPLSEALLDMLAWQFHVDGYEAAYDVEARKRMLLQSLMLHRRKGTAWAVRNALVSAFGRDAGIDEWFNYGGKPYFFRAWLDVTGLFWNEEATPKALRLIYEYKNVRSWLEYLATRARLPMDRLAGIGLVSRSMGKSRLWFMPRSAPPLPLRAGIGLLGRDRAKCRLFFMPAKAAPLPKAAGAALCGASRSRWRLWFPAGASRPLARGLGMASGSMTSVNFQQRKAGEL